jgi:hypothetical protein
VRGAAAAATVAPTLRAARRGRLHRFDAAPRLSRCPSTIQVARATKHGFDRSGYGVSRRCYDIGHES